MQRNIINYGKAAAAEGAAAAAAAASGAAPPSPSPPVSDPQRICVYIYIYHVPKWIGASRWIRLEHDK